MVEAALHQIELQVKLPTTNEGMRVLWQVLPQFVNGFDILSGLKISSTLE